MKSSIHKKNVKGFTQCFHLVHEVDWLLKPNISSKLQFFSVFYPTDKTRSMTPFINAVKLLALDCFHNHAHTKGL